MSISRIDIIGTNGNDGEHYMVKFCKDCKYFKRKTYLVPNLFGASEHYHDIQLSICTNERQKLPDKYLVTGDTNDLAYASTCRKFDCKGDWYE